MKKYYAWMGIAAIVVFTSTISEAAEKPKLFSVAVQDIPNEKVPLVKPWKTIILDKEYRGAWVVAGDLTGDGNVEIVAARASKSPDHYVTAVVAHKLDGSVLWRWGDPKRGINYLGYDVACQIYDWDGDGKNEVVLSTRQNEKTWLVELDGATGAEKRRFEIPNHSADCITFCNLTGNARPTDVLVKTRYTQIWAYNRDGKQLWSSKNPAGCQTAHQVRPMDVDGDGRDELVVGYAMLNADGTSRWDLHNARNMGGHLDCARLMRGGKTPEERRIIFTFCGGNRIASVDDTGKMIWSIAGAGLHYESVDIGNVCPGESGKQIVVDIPYAGWGKCPIQVISEQGEVLGQIFCTYNRFHRLVEWTGDDYQEIIVGQDRCMFDGKGRKIALFDMPLPPGERPPSSTRESIICAVGDMTGNGVIDIIYYTVPGTVVYIYKNTNGKKSEDKVPLGTEMNFTLY